MSFSITKSLVGSLLAGAALLSVCNKAVAAPVVQKIRFVEDDAQKNMASKIYRLKYVKAADLLPFIQDAILRYAGESHASSVNDFANNSQMIIVSTGEGLFPYVDAMIAALDRPAKMNKFGSNILGDGIASGFYRPRFRAAESMREVIVRGDIFSGVSDGAVFFDSGSNLFYFKDTPSVVEDIKQKLGWLDKEIPQVRLELKVYEVRDSDLRDIGIDYLAWKNGPGMNLFAVGYDALDFSLSEMAVQQLGSQLLNTGIDLVGNFTYGFGGIYTAPAFDMSFIRLLQQNGKATISSTAGLTLSNTSGKYAVAFAPEYQNITKDDDHTSDVVVGADSTLDAEFTGITITSGAKGVVNFTYLLNGSNVVERNNHGAEISENTKVSSSASLAFNQEKVLTSWTRTSKVEQTIGVPFLCELPILKYIFGTTTTNIEKTHYLVTVRAVPVRINDNVLPGMVKEFDELCKK